MNPSVEELLWLRVDGELPAAREAELAALLAADREARQAATGIEATATLLAEVPQLDPPPELRPRIDAALAQAGRPVTALRRPLRPLAWLREVPLGSRLAYLAAGLIVGLALGVFFEIRRTPGGVDLGEVSGAMVRPGGSLSWPLEQGAGQLAAARRQGLLRLEIAISGPAPAALTLSGGGSLELVRIEAPHGRSDLAPPPGPELTVAPLASGRYEIEVRPAQPEAPIEIVVRSGGSPVLRRTVRLGELPGG